MHIRLHIPYTLLGRGVTIDMAKVRRFENGLKLSIRGKIVGLRSQDMDSMVGTALAIERDGGHTGHSGCECR